MNNSMKLNSSGGRMVLLKWCGLVVLFLSLTGAKSCMQEDRDLEVVATVEVDAPYHARGSENTYSGETTVAVSDSVDLRQVMEDNGFDEIKQITLESVFYRVTRKDPTPNRTVTANVFSVTEPGGAPQPLFVVASAAVNDPALVNWTPATLTPAGVGVLNAALERVRLFQNSVLTFDVAGNSSPAGVATDFWWGAKVRLRVIGVKKVKVFQPI